METLTAVKIQNEYNNKLDRQALLCIDDLNARLF